MTLWAIVPVKPLRRGKSRLSEVLSEEERTVLNKNLLLNTLKTLMKVKRIDTVMVVSRDPAVLTLAREYGAKTVLEDGNPELNTALRRAALVATSYHANEIIIVPADLPLLSETEIDSILNGTGNPPEVIICPDRRKDGTNMLYVNPASLIQFSYGIGSFNKHMEQAQKADAKLNIIESPTLGLDLDLPEDLDLLNEMKNNTTIKSNT